jgi:hypothetical protein
MLALCPACNLKKGSKLMSMVFSLEPYPGMRTGVLEALLEFEDWLNKFPLARWKEAGEVPDPHWSLIMPTRYGKSDFSRTAALLGQARGLTGPALVVHPGIVLARQYLEKQRFSAWKRRWSVYCSRPHYTLPDFGPRPFQNDEWIGSVHIQALVGKEDLVRDFAESLAAKYNLPPVLFLDETHRYTTANRWGDVARAWEKAGGITVPMTATPTRHDRDDLYGFRRKRIRSESFERSYARSHPDPDKIYVHHDIGERHFYDLEADKEITFKRAWFEKALARSSVDWVDVEMRELTARDQLSPEDMRLKLSEMPKHKVARCLSTVCRDPKVIREFATRIVRHLRTFRCHESTRYATAIVYGLSDFAGMPDDAHLTAVREALLAEDHSLVVQIATLKADGKALVDDEKSAGIIARFTDPSRKAIDILLVKQMGGEGLDDDRIKVVATLDSMRSAGAKIQQWHRGGNIWNQCRHFVIIALKDCMSVEIYENLIEAEGGQATEEDILESEREERPKPDPKEAPLFAVVDTEQSGAWDNDGLVCTAAEYARAGRLLDELPELIHSKSIPEIATKALRLGIQPLPGETYLDAADISDSTSSTVAILNEVVKMGAKLLFRQVRGRVPDFSDKADRDEFGATFKREFIRRLKAAAGVNGSWDQSDQGRIRDVDVLRRLVNVAEQLVKELAGEFA